MTLLVCWTLTMKKMQRIYRYILLFFSPFFVSISSLCKELAVPATPLQSRVDFIFSLFFFTVLFHSTSSHHLLQFFSISAIFYNSPQSLPKGDGRRKTARRSPAQASWRVELRRTHGEKEPRPQPVAGKIVKWNFGVCGLEIAVFYFLNDHHCWLIFNFCFTYVFSVNFLNLYTLDCLFSFHADTPCVSFSSFLSF